MRVNAQRCIFLRSEMQLEAQKVSLTRIFDNPCLLGKCERQISENQSCIRQ
jgi:hypothetical protein